MNITTVRQAALLVLSAGLVGLYAPARADLGPATQPASADPPPATQPADGGLLLDRYPLLVEGLQHGPADDRVRAIRALADLGDVRAAGPLADLLPGRYESAARLRVVDPVARAAGKPADPEAPAFEMDAARRYHIARLTSEAFLAEVLGNERAAGWSWVRRSGPADKPTDLLGRLKASLAAAESSEQPTDIDVRVAGPDAASARDMAFLLLSIYVRDSRVRLAQRQERTQLDAALAQSDASCRRALDQIEAFSKQNDVAGAKARYEEAARKAQPLLARRDQIKQTLAKLEKEIDSAKQERDRIANDQRTEWLYAQTVREYNDLRTHPTDPRSEWQQQVARKALAVQQLANQVAVERDQVDRRDDALSRLYERRNRLTDDLNDAESQVAAVMGDTEQVYLKLAGQLRDLVASAQTEQKKLEQLRAQSARLPGRGELIDATSEVAVVVQPRDGQPISEPLAVRRAAVVALGRLADKSAIDPLIALLADPDEALRQDAAEALKRITRQDFGTDQDKWKAWRAPAEH
ncbi:MAG: hypothetical protein BIFFINMI_03087 [Phycisphaerae bacterium]|nr:hypothetical protein [Phycisphaerae bacterium]